MTSYQTHLNEKKIINYSNFINTINNNCSINNRCNKNITYDNSINNKYYPIILNNNTDEFVLNNSLVYNSIKGLNISSSDIKSESLLNLNKNNTDSIDNIVAKFNSKGNLLNNTKTSIDILRNNVGAKISGIYNNEIGTSYGGLEISTVNNAEVHNVITINKNKVSLIGDLDLKHGNITINGNEYVASKLLNNPEFNNTLGDLAIKRSISASYIKSLDIIHDKSKKILTNHDDLTNNEKLIPFVSYNNNYNSLDTRNSFTYNSYLKRLSVDSIVINDNITISSNIILNGNIVKDELKLNNLLVNNITSETLNLGNGGLNIKELTIENLTVSNKLNVDNFDCGYIDVKGIEGNKIKIYGDNFNNPKISGEIGINNKNMYISKNCIQIIDIDDQENIGIGLNTQKYKLDVVSDIHTYANNYVTGSIYKQKDDIKNIEKLYSIDRDTIYKQIKNIGVVRYNLKNDILYPLNKKYYGISFEDLEKELPDSIITKQGLDSNKMETYINITTHDLLDCEDINGTFQQTNYSDKSIIQIDFCSCAKFDIISETLYCFYIYQENNNIFSTIIIKPLNINTIELPLRESYYKIILVGSITDTKYIDYNFLNNLYYSATNMLVNQIDEIKQNGNSPNIILGFGHDIDIRKGNLLLTPNQCKLIIEGAKSNLDLGSYSLQSKYFISDVITENGPPLYVQSKAMVNNLNAEYLGNMPESFYSKISASETLCNKTLIEPLLILPKMQISDNSIHPIAHVKYVDDTISNFLKKPVFTSIVQGVTPETSSNNNDFATTKFVHNKVNSSIESLINNAPAALDTLGEISAALNNNSTFATSVIKNLSEKSSLNNPEFSDNITVTNDIFCKNIYTTDNITVDGKLISNSYNIINTPGVNSYNLSTQNLESINNKNNNIILENTLGVASDRRIYKNEVDYIPSDTNKIDDIFNLTLNLKLYEYKLKNYIANTNSSKIGWISQDVKNIKPDLINTQDGVEPNIMQEFIKSTNSNENTFNYENDTKIYTMNFNIHTNFTILKSDKKYKMYFYNTTIISNIYDVYVISPLSNNTFKINNDILQDKIYDKIIVIGEIINDFEYIDELGILKIGYASSCGLIKNYRNLIKGNISFENINCSENITISKTADISKLIVNDSLIINASATINKKTTLNSLVVENNANVDTLNVDGNCVLNGLKATGNIELGKNELNTIDINGKTTIYDDLILKGNLSYSKNITLKDTLIFSESNASIVNLNRLDLSGNLTTNNLNVKQNSITNNLTINNNLISSNISASNLTIDNNITINNHTQSNNLTTINLNTENLTTINLNTENLTTINLNTENITTNSLILTSNLSIPKNLMVQENCTLGKNSDYNIILNSKIGNFTMINGAQIYNDDNKLTLDEENIIIKGNLSVKGTTTLNDELILKNNLNIINSNSINNIKGSLTVEGITNIKNSFIVDDSKISVLGGKTTIKGYTHIQDNLTVDNTSFFDGKLTVNGNSYFNEILTANNELKVANGKNTNLTGDLSVSKDTYLKSNLTVNDYIFTNNNISKNLSGDLCFFGNIVTTENAFFGKNVEAKNALFGKIKSTADERIKKDFKPLDYNDSEIFDLINNVMPVRFKYKNNIQYNSSYTIGWIAQDVKTKLENILPGTVSNHEGVIPDIMELFNSTNNFTQTNQNYDTLVIFNETFSGFDTNKTYNFYIYYDTSDDYRNINIKPLESHKINIINNFSRNIDRIRIIGTVVQDLLYIDKNNLYTLNYIASKFLINNQNNIINGNIPFNSLKIDGTLSVAGNTYLESTLSVKGITHLGNSLSVLGDTYIKSSLNVDSDINFSGKLLKNGNEYGSNVWKESASGIFYTNASNIGIGNNDPKYKLDVDGNINFTGKLLKNGNEYGSNVWKESASGIFYTNASNIGIGNNDPKYKLDVDGNINFTGKLLHKGVDYSVSLSDIIVLGESIPNGTISMWNGSYTNIPDGWTLCDGTHSVINGIKIPDLSDKFIIGSNSTDNVGEENTTDTLNIKIDYGSNFQPKYYVLAFIIKTNNLSNKTTILKVKGNSLEIDGALSVVGNTYLASTLSVKGLTHLGNSLSVLGDTYIKSTLNVDSNINFSGKLLKNGNEYGSNVWKESASGIFYTNASNIGIGTSEPKYKLDVDGNINFTGKLLKNGEEFNSGSNGFDVTVLGESIPNGTISMWNGSKTNVPIGWTLCDGNASLVNNVKIPDLSDKFIIGVSKNQDNISHVDKSNSVEIEMNTKNNKYSPDYYVLAFIIKTGNSSTTTKLINVLNNKVGIDVNNPSVILDINGTDAIQLPSGNESQRPDSAKDGMLRFNSESKKFEGYHNSSWREIGSSSSTIQDSDNDTRIEVEENDDDDNIRFYIENTQKMVLNASGNVGIGKNNPKYKLDVDGNINFTGKLLKDGQEFISGTSDGSSGAVKYVQYGITQNINPVAQYPQITIIKHFGVYIKSQADIMTFEQSTGTFTIIAGGIYEVDLYSNYLRAGETQYQAAMSIFHDQKEGIILNNFYNGPATQVLSYNSIIYEFKTGDTFNIQAWNSASNGYLPSNGLFVDGYKVGFRFKSVKYKIGETLRLVDSDNDTRIEVEENDDDDNIRFYIENTQQMVLNASGNVGIGKNNPKYKLDVDGNINFTGKLLKDGKEFISETSDASLNLIYNNNKSNVEKTYFSASGLTEFFKDDLSIQITPTNINSKFKITCDIFANFININNNYNTYNNIEFYLKRFNKDNSNLDLYKTNFLLSGCKECYITGKNATINNSRYEYLMDEDIFVSTKTLIDDVEQEFTYSKNGGSSNNPIYLLYDYGKQWELINVSNKRVSAIFKFSRKINIKQFAFATYNGGNIGLYHGWNLYYKNETNTWVKVIDKNSNQVNIDPAAQVGFLNTDNSEYSYEWNFEILPSNSVYIYWIKVYGSIDSFEKNIKFSIIDDNKINSLDNINYSLYIKPLFDTKCVLNSSATSSLIVEDTYYKTAGFSNNSTSNGSGALQLPIGSDSQRPNPPKDGMLRFNSDSNKFEGYSNSNWTEICGSENASVTADRHLNLIYNNNKSTVEKTYFSASGLTEFFKDDLSIQITPNNLNSKFKITCDVLVDFVNLKNLYNNCIEFILKRFNKDNSSIDLYKSKFRLSGCEECQIIGENATLTDSQAYLVNADIDVCTKSFVDDEEVQEYSYSEPGPNIKVLSNDPIYLLYGFTNIWSINNVANKKVSAIFTFSRLININKFAFATYTYGDNGPLKGWNLYYKNENDAWIKVINNENSPVSTGGVAEQFGYYDTINSEFSYEWKFEVLPSNKLYIYWIKVYGAVNSTKKNIKFSIIDDNKINSLDNIDYSLYINPTFDTKCILNSCATSSLIVEDTYYKTGSSIAGSSGAIMVTDKYVQYGITQSINPVAQLPDYTVIKHFGVYKKSQTDIMTFEQSTGTFTIISGGIYEVELYSNFQKGGTSGYTAQMNLVLNQNITILYVFYSGAATMAPLDNSIIYEFKAGDTFNIQAAFSVAGGILPTTGFQADGYKVGFRFKSVKYKTGETLQLVDSDGDTKVVVEENTDDDKIRLYTSGTERMLINASGNVGIGTNDPKQLLQVGDNGVPGTIQVGANNYCNTFINPGNSDTPHIWVGNGKSDSHPFGTMSDTPDTCKYGFGWEYSPTTGNYNLVRKNNTTNYINTMTISRVTGNVGIGTSSPENNLTIGNGGLIQFNDLTSFGNSKFGAYVFQDKFFINPRNISGGYNNIQGFVVNSSGFVGVNIATGNPSYPLEVQGSALFSSTNFALLTLIGTSPVVNTSSGNLGVSIFTEKAISASEYYARSDSRIKTNIEEILDNEALIKFRQLKPCKYNYVDIFNRGSDIVYGFIAQEVKQVMPYATNILRSKEFIPNIYKLALYNNNIIIFDTEHNLDSNGNIRLYLSTNKDIIVPYTIVDTLKINIDTSNLSVEEKPNNDLVQGEDGSYLPHNIFVYGTEVDDFHTLNKDAIWTTAAAALQEVDRIQQSEKIKVENMQSEINKLKNENLEIKNQYNILTNKYNELLERIIKLETS